MSKKASIQNNAHNRSKLTTIGDMQFEPVENCNVDDVESVVTARNQNGCFDEQTYSNSTITDIASDIDEDADG